MLTHSPSAILFSRIKAELIANGTGFTDAAAEAVFRAWFQTALADSGYTSDFAVLYQPNASTAFSVGVRVGTAGHKVNVWWGDGGSNSYTPSTSSNTTVAHTYGSAAKRPIVVLGRITYWSGPEQAFGGRLWENLRSLTYLSCWGCTNLTGSISSLPAGVVVLDANGTIFTYPSNSGSRVWADNMRYVNVNPPSAGTFSSEMVDSLLIDLADVETWTGTKYISAAGNCGVPTSAADDAISALIDAGVTVITN